jgi:mannose-6-phosphate isomerase-like protein (cupin superfamily)
MSIRAKFVSSGTGPAYCGPGDQITFLLTGADTAGALFLCEVAVPPLGGPPPHIHHREDESLFVIEGELTFQLAGKPIHATAGDLVYVPRGTVHNFQNTGQSRARMIVLTTPAGLEKFFEEAFVPALDRNADPPLLTGEIMEKFLRVAPLHGLEMMLPAQASR